MSQKSLTHAIFQKATEKSLQYSERHPLDDLTFPNRPCGPVKDAVFDGENNESTPTS